MVLIDIGDMIIKHSSGGSSTEFLVASENEQHKVRIQIGLHIGSSWRQITLHITAN